MDYENFCKRCKHYSFDLGKGILWGLTNGKRSFDDRCVRFEPGPQREESLGRNLVYEEEREHEEEKRQPFSVQSYSSVQVWPVSS